MTVNTRADTKIEEMRVSISNVEGRFQQIERTFPERFHNVESRQAGCVETINALTKHLQEKFQEIEELIKARPSGPPVPPSFGGPRASNGEFYIGSATGSPLSGPPVQNVAAAPSLDPWANFANSRTSYSSGGLNSTSTPTAAPTLGSVMDPPPGMASTPVTHKPWDSKLWSTNEKVSKELKPFDGSHGKYKIWASRLKDHFIKRNPDWQFLFTEIESHKFPVTKDNLKLGFLKTEQYTIDIDFAWTATTLWTFIGEHVVDSLYNIRNVLAGGHNNGLELWRALFVKHEGGADQVELSGMGSLHSFPPCEKVDQLQFWVGKWQEMKDMYGAGISDAHLRSMFINILLESVRKDIREKPGLITLQLCIDHVIADIGRLNDVQLWKMHSDRLKQSFSSTQRISPVLDKEEHIEKTADVPKPEDQFQTLFNALSNKMENLVAAIARPNARPGPKRAPSQFAKYGDKCLHCGSGDHRALECQPRKHCWRRMVEQILLDTGVHLINGRKSSRSLSHPLLMLRISTTMNIQRPISYLYGACHNVPLDVTSVPTHHPSHTPMLSPRCLMQNDMMTTTTVRPRSLMPSNNSPRRLPLGRRYIKRSGSRSAP